MRSLLAIGLLAAACRPTAPPTMPYDYSNGEDVVRAIHDRYVTRWFDNVTYVLQPVPVGDEAPGRAWLVAYDSPSRLRVDIDPREQGNGMLIVGDSQVFMAAGRPARTARLADPAMLWQHDIYVLPPSAMIARLRAAGFDLGAVRQAEWKGRPAVVLGRGGREAWIDRELMLLVRLVAPTSERPAVFDQRFEEYERIGSAWIPRRISVFEGERERSRAELKQIRANIQLDSLLFVPGEWLRARHWYQDPTIRERRSW